MSNNFKVIISGAQYVAESGHDSNDGADPNRPKKTIASSSTTKVIGCGNYSLPSNAAGALLYGDGKVILNGGGNTSGFGYPIDCEVIGTSWLASGANSDLVTDRALRTIWRNSTFNIRGGTGSTSNWIKDNLFIGCTVIMSHTNTSSNNSRISTSIFINSSITMGISGLVSGGSTLRWSYIDTNSIIILISSGTVFIGNNIQGIVRVGGVDYELKKDKAGNTINPNPSLPDVVAAIPSIYTNGNYNEDPKFNNAASGDYSLQADSPMLRGANNGLENVGGYFAPLGISVLNTDDGNSAGTRVIASAAIDTSIPDAYKLASGQTEGFVDYVFFVGGFVLQQLRILDNFNFDSDSAGGTTNNNNVVDAQPLTADYARRTTTTGNTGSASTLLVPTAAGIQIGDSVRVNGQERGVYGKSSSGGNDTITLDTALSAVVATGTTVTYGTPAQLKALLPNRLTVLMRTRNIASAPSYPFVDSEWDNEVSSAYGVAGQFFQQELDKKPGLIISGSNVYGAGDSDAPTGITAQDLSPQWVHVRVYKRNNYSSNGL